MTAFSKYDNPKDVSRFLIKSINRRNKAANKMFIYHYSDIDSIVSMVKKREIWLGNPMGMNDLLEKQMLVNANINGRIFFTSFSKAKENIAMYRMYPGKKNDLSSGAMLQITYAYADRMITESGSEFTIIKSVDKDNWIENGSASGLLYWSSVCYKNPTSNFIRVNTVNNNKLDDPLNSPVLCGQIKINGWEYEKEVRIIAKTDVKLDDSEKLCLKLPSFTHSDISVVLCPGFDKLKNDKLLSQLYQMDIDYKESYYNGLMRWD